MAARTTEPSANHECTFKELDVFARMQANLRLMRHLVSKESLKWEIFVVGATALARRWLGREFTPSCEARVLAGR